MTTTQTHPALQPANVGPVQLSNRLAVAPMTRISATPDGLATAEMASYYEGFAKGGFGLVITEGIYPDHEHSQGYLNQPGLADDRQAEAWGRVTDRVHAAGAAVIAQLMHAGALTQGNPHREDTIAPSAVRPRGEMMPDYGGSGPWPVPRAMSLGDIDDVVRGFGDAARRALRAGFDGIEIHSANGYLLDQFVTRYTNQRTDEYGGSDANRIRLTARIVSEVRRILPEEFVVGVRLSQTKVNDLTYRWSGAAEAETHFLAVADAGASYIHVASGDALGSRPRSWTTARPSPGSRAG